MEYPILNNVRAARIIRSRRKTLALVMTADAMITIRAPLRMPLTDIEHFVTKKQPWIVRAQQRILAKPKIEVSKEQIGEYRQRASELIPPRVKFFAEHMGLNYSSVRITSARQRWGSCGPHGSLNFTWRLMLAPNEVIDYVVVHELAHIIYRGHGPRFWHIVASIMPNFKNHKKWLREHTII